ncbi:hypothetical protein ACKC9G_12790 [Pokkaliibacter sp. CJK22405]|uniref:hypothetical protein n=1 Tax=Pokkaliibacter sp. CJK22405 TaxID=3384615 RepID=UPI003984691E
MMETLLTFHAEPKAIPLLEPLILDVQCHSEDWSQQQLLLCSHELDTYIDLPQRTDKVHIKLESLYSELMERHLDCIRDEDMPLGYEAGVEVPRLVVTLYRLAPVRAYLSRQELDALWQQYSPAEPSLH